MSEYDATSKVPNDAFRDNYDKIFGKKKQEEQVRQEAELEEAAQK